MRGYVLSSAACGVSQIFPACGAPKFGVGPTPNLGRLYPCGSQNWDGRKKGGCRHKMEGRVFVTPKKHSSLGCVEKSCRFPDSRECR